MIDLPENAEILCSDGIAGHMTNVIVNPISKQITHLVVKSNWPSSREYMVPFQQVVETAPDMIRLECSQNDLKMMEPFISEAYFHTKLPDYERYQSIFVWPMVLPAADNLLIEVDTFNSREIESSPLEEIAVRRGAKVEATDGHLGQVDELLINSNNMQVTHLILRERHILKQREVAIPVSQIDYVDEDSVFLKLDKKSVEELPTIPIQRWAYNHGECKYIEFQS